MHRKTQAKGEKRLFLTQLKVASGAWPPSSVLPPSYRQMDWGGWGELRVGGAELCLLAQHVMATAQKGPEPESFSGNRTLAILWAVSFPRCGSHKQVTLQMPTGLAEDTLHPHPRG